MLSRLQQKMLLHLDLQLRQTRLLQLIQMHQNQQSHRRLQPNLRLVIFSIFSKDNSFMIKIVKILPTLTELFGYR
jgi:hypothetical protein